MRVYKYHAFIYFLRPPPWSGTHTYNWQSFRYLHTIIMYTFRLTIHAALSPCFLSPCWFPFAPLSYSLLLTWNPPCCDRIHPPWSQVACKLTSPSLVLPTPSPFQIPSTQVIYTPHYDNFKTPASPVWNTLNVYVFVQQT